MDVFRTEANVVLELTGDSRQYERLLAVKPSRVEVISTRGARLMLDVLQQARNSAWDPDGREGVKEGVKEVSEVVPEVAPVLPVAGACARGVEGVGEIASDEPIEGFRDPRGLVDAVWKAAAEWEAFLGVAEAIARERDQLGARCTELERESEQLRVAHERLLHEHHATVEALGELRAAQRHDESTRRPPRRRFTSYATNMRPCGRPNGTPPRNSR